MNMNMKIFCEMNYFILLIFLFITCILHFATSLTAIEHEQALRASLLNNYDKEVPPATALKTEPVQVSLGVNVYKIQDISLSTGMMEINAWFRMSWKDSRLTWNTSAHGNIEEIQFRANPREEGSEIWAPDVELYNSLESIYEISRKAAQIWSDGSVFLSRPGIYRILCNFEGTYLFPYDSFYCPLDFGGWSVSGFKVNYTYDLGLSYSSTATAGDTKFTGVDGMINDKSWREEYYPCCPNEPWPTVKFTISVQQETFTFSKSIIAMNVGLVFLNFLTLWMDVDFTDALGIGATLLITLIFLEFSANSLIPLQEEVLWIEKFIILHVTISFCCVISVAIATYYDLINQRFYQRMSKTPQKKDREFNGLRDFLVRSLVVWIIPGAHFGRSMEMIGLANYGEIIKFLMGFILPFAYGIIMLDLAEEMNAASIEDGKAVATSFYVIGYFTLYGSIFSISCELSTRYLGVNPKIGTEHTIYVNQGDGHEIDPLARDETPLHSLLRRMFYMPEICITNLDATEAMYPTEFKSKSKPSASATREKGKGKHDTNMTMVTAFNNGDDDEVPED